MSMHADPGRADPKKRARRAKGASGPLAERRPRRLARNSRAGPRPRRQQDLPILDRQELHGRDRLLQQGRRPRRGRRPPPRPPPRRLSQGRRIAIWTHAARGLTENDFILAAKIDQIPVKLKQGADLNPDPVPSRRQNPRRRAADPGCGPAILSCRRTVCRRPGDSPRRASQAVAGQSDGRADVASSRLSR